MARYLTDPATEDEIQAHAAEAPPMTDDKRGRLAASCASTGAGPEHLRETDSYTGRSYADGAEYLLCPGWVERHLFDQTPDDTEPGELSHDNQPVEIIPFGWHGGDSLHYGWVVLAPELDLDDFPCVSYSPSDVAACWLGDNTRQAFREPARG